MIKLRKYQRLGVDMIDAKYHGRVLLADDMGLGKTAQTLTYFKEQELFPAVVICPAYLKFHWEREAKEHFGIRAEVLFGRKVKPPFSKSKLYVINYDILQNWLPWLKKLKPKLLVVDECEYLKDPNTKRTKAFKELVKGIEQIIMISGNAGIENRPIELWVALNTLRPDIWHDFRKFAFRHCRPRWKPWGWEFKGAEHLPELHKKMKRYVMIRRKVSDVLKELPPLQHQVIPIEIKNRREYNHAVTDFISWMRKTYPQRVARVRNAERLAQLSYLKKLAAQLKLPSVIEWIRGYLDQTDQKLLVFGYHRSILLELEKEFGKQSLLVHGGTTPKRRQIMFDRFNHDKRIRLMFGNIDAAGRGWSARCPGVAKIELVWKPGTHGQAIKRIHGLGRGVEGTPSTAYWLVAKDTIEERLCSVIQEKQSVIDQIVDGVEDESQLDIFDMLTNELMKGRRAA